MIAKSGWLIGELSRKLEIPPQTIRYYERLGLLDPPRRTTSQYRLYSETDETRLQFIQKAKRFGLSLAEIRQLIQIRAGGTSPCADLRRMVKHHLDDLDQHIQEMLTLRQELATRLEQIEALLSDAAGHPTEVITGQVCGLIERDLEGEVHEPSNPSLR